MMKRWTIVVTVLLAVAAMVSATGAFAKEKQEPKAHYELDFTGTTGTLETGKEGTISVAIKPTDGYHMNAEYPFKLTVADVEGLDFGKKKFVKNDIKDINKPALAIPFKGVKPGKYTVTLNFSFAVCTADICEVRKPSVPVPIEVK
jgi:hypothetical protein